MAGNAGNGPRRAAQVLADIKLGKFAPVYILFGADSAAADELLRALREALVQAGMEAFDFELVHADELEIPILLQHIRQPPVASKRRLVVVRGIDRLSKGRTKKREERGERGEEPVKIVAWLGGAFLRLVQNRGDEKRARLCLLQLYEINRDIISGHPEAFALLETFTVCTGCPAEERYCPVYADARPPEFCIRRKKRRDRTRGRVTEVSQ
jgi:hypothetical protein